MDLDFLPKLLLQHDSSPQEVLEDVRSAWLQALRQRQVHATVSPSGTGLAVALGQRLVLLTGLFRSRPAVEFVSAVEAPESLTALAWLAAGSGPSAADECLLLGTSAGHLQLHSATSGALLLRQQLHHTAIVSIAVRWSGTGSDPDDLSEDVTLGFADAVVRLPAWEVWAAVRYHSGRSGGGSGGWWGGGAQAAAAAQHHQLSFSKFQLPKGSGPRSHSLCLGPPPSTLYAALSGRPQPARLRILTAGVSPPLAAYEGQEAPSQGLLSLVSDLASSSAHSLLSAARSYVPSGPRALLSNLRRGRSGVPDGGASPSAGISRSSSGIEQHKQQQQQQQQGRGGRQGKDSTPGEPASLAAAVWDEKRAVTQMAFSPCGRLAACCDSLGRVVLVDTSQTLVVRMLKGYRDAQVAWLVVCGNTDGGTGGTASWHGQLSSSARSAATPGQQLPRGGSASSKDEGSFQSLGGSSADLAALQQAQQGQQEQQGQQQESGSEQGGQQAQQGQQGAGRCRHLFVTYAPRRASVEIWEPQALTCLGSIACSVPLGLLLQQPARRAGGGGGSGMHAPNRCLLLDGSTLALTDLTDALKATL